MAIPELLELLFASHIRVQQLVDVVCDVADALLRKGIAALLGLSPVLHSFPHFQRGNSRHPRSFRCFRWLWSRRTPRFGLTGLRSEGVELAH